MALLAQRARAEPEPLSSFVFGKEHRLSHGYSSSAAVIMARQIL
ncbi:hypothetical protein NX02_04215 [Sphingomonas sanxanigenens DSM 19645 = NX02]|uniref:Uncharacterized protein n=1 Tax=Sphingomonas sanxanigenens DSM 19645 = NX02 TaxID=1123269 RepID=W0A6A8_9SPHN|nr:hypothetical protein NX02_04215 [Sphingomonas sanxanigenens DSM 19645 = NX02]